MTVDDIGVDLLGEQTNLDRIVSALDEESWATPTPAEPWTVADQITHLTFFDEQATLAITDPDEFTLHSNKLLQRGGMTEDHLAMGRRLPSAALLDWWRDARANLMRAASGLDPLERIPWYGPPMRPETFLRARLMETWAHGQDVVDALGATRAPTDRLAHVAELGVRTFGWSFRNRSEAPPDRVAVRLHLPSGSTMGWNEEADQSVAGSVEDFPLVVTQRRHVDDTALLTAGPDARRWMEIAQAFAGPPGPGRQPGSVY